MTCPTGEFNTYIDVINCLSGSAFDNDLILGSAILMLLIMFFMFKTRFTLAAAVSAGLGITYAFTVAYGGIWEGFLYILIVLIAVLIVAGWVFRAER